jgi:hypothetical protein
VRHVIILLHGTSMARIWCLVERSWYNINFFAFAFTFNYNYYFLLFLISDKHLILIKFYMCLIVFAGENLEVSRRKYDIYLHIGH